MLSAPPIGSYTIAHRTVYVGVEAEPPDRPVSQYYDTETRRIGELEQFAGTRYATDGSPTMVFALARPTIAVAESKFVAQADGGTIGFSLWYAPNLIPRATIILIHGADDETRDMGFLVPYFVTHGLNVVTYDQRGTGLSKGSWRYTGPRSKAQDVLAIIAALRHTSRVDSRRIGVWGFSNGGWTAPIVAAHYPLAFMILKSAPSESITKNVLYEIEQSLREHGKFSETQISRAMTFERVMLHAVETNTGWDAAATALDKAKSQPWFPSMRIPPEIRIPPPAPQLEALQESLVYDPSPALRAVKAPTLAIFGARDKNVDVPDSEARLRSAFARAGMRDFSVQVYPNAGHTLVQSQTGYEDDPALPERSASGYPEGMISWLTARGFAKRSP